MDENPYKSPESIGSAPPATGPRFGRIIRSLARIVLSLFGFFALLYAFGFAVVFMNVAAASQYLGYSLIALALAAAFFVGVARIPR